MEIINKNLIIKLRILIFSTLLSLLFLVWCGFFLKDSGYLPYPFFFDASNSFGDFYSITSKYHSQDKYTEWASVYPPLNFLITRLMSDEACLSFLEFIQIRSCDGKGIFNLGIVYVATAIVLSLYGAKHINRRRKINTGFCFYITLFFWVLFSFPFVFGFERGNLIIFALLFLVLENLSTNLRLKAILLSLASNIKIYMAVLLLPYIVSKRTTIIGVFLASFSMILVLSSILLGDMSSVNIFANLIKFNARTVSFSEVMHDSSLIGIISKAVLYDGLHTSKIVFLKLPLAILKFFILAAASLCYLLVIYKLWNRSLRYKKFIEFYTLVYLFLITSALGPYATMLMIPYVLYFYDKLKIHQVVFVMFILTPIDSIIYPLQNYTLPSFYTSQLVTFSTGISLGFITKPISVICLFISISYSAIVHKRYL